MVYQTDRELGCHCGQFEEDLVQPKKLNVRQGTSYGSLIRVAYLQWHWRGADRLWKVVLVLAVAPLRNAWR